MKKRPAPGSSGVRGAFFVFFQPRREPCPRRLAVCRQDAVKGSVSIPDVKAGDILGVNNSARAVIMGVCLQAQALVKHEKRSGTA
jgi:hypothetical protein